MFCRSKCKKEVLTRQEYRVDKDGKPVFKNGVRVVDYFCTICGEPIQPIDYEIARNEL